MDSLLIANRGEIVSRIGRTAQRLGLRTVGVFSDPDRESPAMAAVDVAIHLPGTTAAETYLDQARVLAAAEKAGVDAIHPGFGFLAENAAFAQSVIDAGLTWVGPAPEHIAAMGDKVNARQLAADAGIPVLTAASIDDAAEVEYPVIVKAAAGGGGKGMRIVESASGLAAAIESARGEALRSFGNDTVYVERYLPAARHIEVQVFGDRHGRVVHLYERECSVQRRHQKIIEESPSPGIDDELRVELCDAAVRLAANLGYEGAGTVEFVVGAGRFFFIEMNTRLQVEHPVTEELTGIDLVEWQLRVAAGEALPLDQDEIKTDGHAIEVRLYAEDPAADWAPATGTVHMYRHGDGARYESAISTGSVITPHYDPMIAKVISHAPTRGEAARILAGELDRVELHGPVTNRDMLAATLRSPAYLAGETTTSFVADHPELLGAAPAAETQSAHLAAALWMRAQQNRQSDRLWGFAPAGWRNVRSQQSQANMNGDLVRYRIRPDGVEFGFNGESVIAAVSGDGPHLVEVDGVALMCSVRRVGSDFWVNSAGGQSRFVETPRFEVHDSVLAGGGPTAPMPGTVVEILVAVGDHVGAETDLLVMEAMKMEHRVRPPGPAVVAEILVAAGDQVDAGQLLVRLEEE